MSVIVAVGKGATVGALAQSSTEDACVARSVSTQLEIGEGREHAHVCSGVQQYDQMQQDTICGIFLVSRVRCCCNVAVSCCVTTSLNTALNTALNNSPNLTFQKKEGPFPRTPETGPDAAFAVGDGCFDVCLQEFTEVTVFEKVASSCQSIEQGEKGRREV